MIDLHCHLLPGIDDGPKTLAESLEMARYAVSSGITKIVATPHITPGRYDNSIATITPAFNILKDAIKAQNIAIELSFAAEIRFDLVIVEMVNKQVLPVLGQYQGADIMLLEFPHSHIPPGATELIQWLGDKGIRAMIAHPERNQGVLVDIEKIAPFVKLGCLLQITGGSLTGVFNRSAKHCATELLKRGWATIVASDAHNVHARCPELEPARQEAIHIVGEDEANALVIERPREISSMHFNKA